MRNVFVALALLALVSAIVPASDLHWYSHSTDYFTFIYRAPHRAAIDELSSFADEVYAEVTGFFASEPGRGRVPVVVFGETDLANGYYSSGAPQHIGLFIAQPSLPWAGAGTESWLRLLFVHELTHYVHANYERGFYRLLGTLFGQSLSGWFLAVTPRWTTEGIAVNTETMYTSGGRGRDPFFEMRYKAPVVENELFTLFQAGYDSHLAPRGRYYVAGYYIWDYLLEEYGEEYVSELLDEFARFPFLGIWGPIRRTTGERMRTIYPRIAAHLTARYERERRQLPAPRISPAVRSDYYLPVETERGLYLYRTRPDAPPAIVLFDLDSGQERSILAMPLTDHASWSVTADGGTIAFATLRVDGTFADEPAAYSDLVLYDVDTRRTIELTSHGGYHQPAIAPDGSYLIAVERAGRYQRLVRFDLDAGINGLVPRPLVEMDEGRFYTPVISPNGERVAVVANQRGVQQILLVNPLDGSYTPLPQPADGFPYYPTFADDRVLLYGHDRGGTLGLYRHVIDSDDVRLVAEDRIGAFAGSIVSGELVFASYTSDGHALRSGSRAPGVVVETVTASPPRSLTPPPPITAGRYRPVPAPTIWFPIPGIAGPGPGLSGLGAGVFVRGADILRRNTWVASAIYFPALTQANYFLFWATHYGRVGFTADASARYFFTPRNEDDHLHARVLRHSASLSYLLRSEYRLGVASSATVGLRATHLLAFTSDSPFRFGGARSPGVDLNTNRIDVGVHLSTVREPLSSRRAFHAPWKRALEVSLSTPIEAPSFEPRSLAALTRARLNVGLGASDHVVTLAPAASFATAREAVTPLGLRGFGPQTDHSAFDDLRGRYRLAVEYHTPHLLIDVPILPSVGVTGLGLSLFAETYGGYDAPPVRAAVSPMVGFGAELTTVITYWGPLPFALGVAARVNPAHIESFSFPQDLAIYLRAGLLELLPAARGHRFGQ